MVKGGAGRAGADTHASLALEMRMNISSAASSQGTLLPRALHDASDRPGFLSGCHFLLLSR
jgi:hypothetical protein